MTTTLWMSALATMLVLIATTVMVVRVLRKQAHPPLAMWLLCLGATMLSVGTYFLSGSHTLMTGAQIVIDLLSCIAIVIAIIASYGWRIRFNTFEHNYLIAEAILLLVAFVLLLIGSHTTVYWLHILVQVLITVGYLPAIQHMWRQGRNTEALPAWFIMFASSVLYVYPGLVVYQTTGDFLPVVYALRSVISIALMIVLALWFRRFPVIREGIYRDQAGTHYVVYGVVSYTQSIPRDVFVQARLYLGSINGVPETAMVYCERPFGNLVTQSDWVRRQPWVLYRDVNQGMDHCWLMSLSDFSRYLSDGLRFTYVTSRDSAESLT